RIFQRFLHGHQTQHGFAAVDDAVVVGHGKVVHGAHHHLAVFDHSAILGGVHAQDSGLRGVDDGGGHHRAEGPAIGDGESTTGHFFNAQLTVSGLLAKFCDLLFDLSKAHLVGIAQDWHHQTTGRTNRDTDVEVAVV